MLVSFLDYRLNQPKAFITALVNRFKGIKVTKEQHVLKDISFEVEEGDFFFWYCRS